MGLIDQLRSLVWGPGVPQLAHHSSYRCIKCGADHDRGYKTCPDCGGAFVVPHTPDEDNASEGPP
jgi:rRNA maturation endonuclease Nob1